MRNSEDYGWDVVNLDYIKRPHKGLSGFIVSIGIIMIIFCIFIICSAIFLLSLSMFTDSVKLNSEAAKGLLVSIGAVLATPFLVWRTWIGHQQWLVSAEQAKNSSDEMQTSLLTKAIEIIDSASRKEIDGKAYNSDMSRLGAIAILRRIGIESQKDTELILDYLIEYFKWRTEGRVRLYYNMLDEEERGHSMFEESEFPRTEADVSLCFKSIIEISPRTLRKKRIEITGGLICGVDFNGMEFKNVNIIDTIMIEVNFRSSVFTDCYIDLWDASTSYFYGANLEGAEIGSVRRRIIANVDAETIPPVGWVLDTNEGSSERLHLVNARSE